METLSNLGNTVRKSVWGDSAAQETTTAQETTKEEPNTQEVTTQESTAEEPPSGETGKGTATEPYDGGNAPEQEVANKEVNPPEVSPAAADTTTSGPTSALENATEKPSLANARMPSFAMKETATGTIVDPSAAAESAPGITEKKDEASAAALPDQEPIPDLVKEMTKDKEPATAVGESQVKKNEAYSPFAEKQSSSGGDDSSLRTPRHDSADRSVSPGTRPDGSHVETGKSEKTKLSDKLKGKFHLGSKH